MYDQVSQNGLSTYQEVQLPPDAISINSDENSSQYPEGKKIYRCEICNVEVNSYNVFKRHEEGKKHLKRVERQGKKFECELCPMTANSQSQLETHLKGSKHRRSLFKKEHGADLSHKGLWIIIFCVACIFLNFLLLFKVVL